MRYIHWRDDFSITESFSTAQASAPVPQRVRIEYFTANGRGRFVAERNGNQFSNCELSDGGTTLTVHLSLRDNPIGHGRLLRLATVITVDASFPGGVRYSSYPGKLEAILYFGKSDGPLDMASEIVFDGVDRLSLLQDVNLSSPAAGDLLSWNGSRWTNIPQSAVRPDLSGYVLRTELADALLEIDDYYAAEEDLLDLSTRLTALENRSPWIDDGNGNLTLDTTKFSNVWIPGWFSIGGVGGSGSGSGGSTVSISDLLSSGTKIATLTIDGTDYDILAPSGAGGGSGSGSGDDGIINSMDEIGDVTYDNRTPHAGDLLTFRQSAWQPVARTDFENVQPDWDETDDESWAYIKHKPTIPTVPTDVSAFNNDAGYLTSSALSGYATETWVQQQGYLTSSALSGYATQTWVSQQGYLTSSDLSNYVTKSGDEEITGAKTFKTSNITMRGISLLPYANNTCYIGSITSGSVRRFAGIYGVDADFSGNVVIGGKVGLPASGSAWRWYIDDDGSAYFDSTVTVDSLVVADEFTAGYITANDLEARNSIILGDAEIVYDDDVDAVYIKHKTTGQVMNLYVDGWFAAGGIGQDGGSGVSALDDLSDVSISSPSNGQALVYRNGYWVNEAIQSGGSTVSWGTAGTDYVPLTVDGTTKNLLTKHQSISGKADKVSNATNGNFAALDANGNLVDSGHKHSDYLTSVPDLSGTYVTLATAQSNISGAKTFKAEVSLAAVNLAFKDSTGATTRCTIGAGLDNGAEYLAISFPQVGGVNQLYYISNTSFQPRGADKNLGTSYTRWATIYGVNGNLSGTLSVTGLSTLSGGISLGGTYNSADSQLVWDSSASAWHLIGNMYVDGWFASGGISQDGNTYTIDGDLTVTGRINGLSVTNSSNGYIEYYTDGDTGTEKLYIQTNARKQLIVCTGNNSCLSVGGYVDYNYKFRVSGNAIATSWDTTSDRRLKDNIVSLSRDVAINTVMALRPSIWTWNFGLAEGKMAAGFIAQDIESVVPYMVSGEDYKSLNYQMLHAFEVGAIQSHEERIAELEAEVERLNEKIRRMVA